jgi:hypothetical protein
MATSTEAKQAYLELQREGTILAGGLTDLAQRATVYRHLYRESGGNHIFPLIAAHGALWARGYFRFGLRLGQVLSWQYALSPAVRAQQLAALNAFADAFRDINRRVCVDSYVNFHWTARFGDTPEAEELVSPDLLEALNGMHAARRAGRLTSEREKLALFQTHFLNEQQYVVGPSLERAAEAFDWPLVKALAIRPLIRFAYFPRRRCLWFTNFVNREERIENGLRAFNLGSQVGWDTVERTLRHYAILPEAFFSQPAAHFSAVRNVALATE